MQHPEIVYLPCGELTPYSKNAKKHDKQQIHNVAESIRQFGFVQPVVIDKDNIIVIGHCRVLAAKELKLDEVPCVRVDDLTKEQVDALRIIDNKSNESPWDKDVLSDILGGINLDCFAFDFDINGAGEKTPPEVEFSEVLGEENNYIILQFKTGIDWLQAESIFGITQAKALSTRGDGKLTAKMTRMGVGRVLDGAKAIERLLGDRK